MNGSLTCLGMRASGKHTNFPIRTQFDSNSNNALKSFYESSVAGSNSVLIMQLDTWFLSGWSSVGVNAFETEIMDNGFHRIYSHGKRMADAGIPKNLKPIPINPFSLKRSERLLAQLRAFERDKAKGLCGNYSPRPKFKRKPGGSLPKPTLVDVEPPRIQNYSSPLIFRDSCTDGFKSLVVAAEYPFPKTWPRRSASCC